MHRKTCLQQATCDGAAVCMVSRFLAAMLLINENEEPGIDKNLFRFPLADTVLVCALASIALVPVKTRNVAEVKHLCILT